MKPKKKKPKKKGKTYYQQKGCTEAKRICRKKGKCEICGKTNCKVEAHHLLTVGAHKNMSNYLSNLIALCVHCHVWGKISFHGSGTDLMDKLFKKKFPGRLNQLRKIALTRKNVNYEEEYKILKEM
jgi:5-methylcytosine-specific restriction endonuclease McrA